VKVSVTLVAPMVSLELTVTVWPLNPAPGKVVVEPKTATSGPDVPARKMPDVSVVLKPATSIAKLLPGTTWAQTGDPVTARPTNAAANAAIDHLEDSRCT